jgi:prepilin-type N-terminal cleavage/methylation domain-containing protein
MTHLQENPIPKHQITKIASFSPPSYRCICMKKHTTLKSKFNAAFSLIELLVVIAVIAIIAAIAIPNITGIREGAQQATANYDQATIDRLASQAAAAGATPEQIAAFRENGTPISITVEGLDEPIVFSLD